MKKQTMRKRNMRKSLAAAVLLSALAVFAGCAKKPDPAVIRKEAVTLFQKGDYAAAYEKFGEALDASRGRVSELQYDILKYRAECELRMGDYKTAKESYEALLQLDEKTADQEEYSSILNELDALDAISEAGALFASGEYKHAYDALEPFSVLDGSLAGKTAWYNQAVCKEFLGDFDEASKMLQEYILMYPDEEAAKKEAAFCRTRSGAAEQE